MRKKRIEVLRAVKKVGKRGAHFQSRDVRDALRIRAGDRKGAISVYNYINAFLKEGLIEEIPGKRKRNKYYRISDAEKFRNLPITRRSSSSEDSGSAADRLSRIETTVRNLEEQLEELNGKVSEMLEILS